MKRTWLEIFNLICEKRTNAINDLTRTYLEKDDFINTTKYIKRIELTSAINTYTDIIQLIMTSGVLNND